MPSPSRWPVAFALIIAGVIAAFQIGKAAIAIPLLRQDLGLGLSAASWIVGAFGALGAATGLLAGIAVSRIGARKALIGGFVVIALGSFAGALSTSGMLLLITRMVEGCGFLAVVIAAPALLRLVTDGKDRDVAFTLWAAYVATGTSVMMLAAPLLTKGGWQTLWWANGLIAALYALLLWRVVSNDAALRSKGGGDLRSDVLQVLRASGPRLLALAFAAYTVQYYAVTALLPSLFIDRLHLSVSQAGLLSAGIVFANAIGNMAAGLLLRWGAPLWAIAASCFLVVGLLSIGIFAPGLPVALVAGMAAAGLAISGLIPASILAASPRLSPNVQLLPITLGLLMQASNVGLLIGPALLGSWVDLFGWTSASLVLLALASIGVVTALRVRRLLPHRS